MTEPQAQLTQSEKPIPWALQTLGRVVPLASQRHRVLSIVPAVVVSQTNVPSIHEGK